ncbi:hypothetical protein ACFSTH_09330 [Paenibacillus yanchengensis]|uniref:DUF3298 domain-containing protein n=1 Tax=Paenibacillus yanchengensis TaxID=2035833 RepID=A0ABW4YGI8_9BACL
MLKQRMIWIIATIMICYLISDFLWNQHLKLQEPAFIPQYTEVLIHGQSFSFYYLEDVETSEPLQHIQIDELQGLFKIEGPSVIERYGQQYLKSIIYHPMDGHDYTGLVDQTFTTATAFFTGNKQQSIDIGKLKFLSNAAPDNSLREPLHTLTSGSSSNNEHLYIVQTNTDIELTALSVSFPELIEENIRATIKQTDHYLIEQGEGFTEDAFTPLNELSLPLTFETGDIIFASNLKCFPKIYMQIIVHVSP